MKNLISVLSISGLIALSNLSYAQEQLKQPVKINIRDVPFPRPEQLVKISLVPKPSSIIAQYDTDGDNLVDLQFWYVVSGIQKDNNMVPYLLKKPLLVSIDLNRDYEISDDEVFEIDYTNSQLTNPLERKSETLKMEIKPKIIFPRTIEKKLT